VKVLDLVRGGTIAVLDVQGEHVVVLSSRASPPGSPLEATLESGTLRLKVRSCQKVDPDEAGRTYRIDGRLVSLTREQREALSRE
jgi:hypothetical protein